MRRKLLRSERGAALLETAITLPLIMLVAVGIFEFGRAYQTWQVLTNAAREGARVAVINGTTETQIKDAVINYADVGGVAVTASQISVVRDKALGSWTGSEIAVSYPFQFMVLGPIAKLVVADSKAGDALTMSAVAVMRNESL